MRVNPRKDTKRNKSVANEDLQDLQALLVNPDPQDHKENQVNKENRARPGLQDPQDPPLHALRNNLF